MSSSENSFIVFSLDVSVLPVITLTIFLNRAK